MLVKACLRVAGRVPPMAQSTLRFAPVIGRCAHLPMQTQHLFRYTPARYFQRSLRVATSSMPPPQEILTDTHCPGCGAPFQHESPEKPGYLVLNSSDPRSKEKRPEKASKKSMTLQDYNDTLANLDEETRSLLENTDPDAQPCENTESDELEERSERRTVCQRCHRLEYNNALVTESTPRFLRESQQYGSLDFLKTKRNPLIVVVFDVTDLPFSLGSLPSLIQQNSSARVILAANKMDLMPSKARSHEQRIRDWIVQHVKHLGLPTRQIVHVSLISATKGWGISGLLKHIKNARMPTDDVYLVGCTNVGKSALMNKFVAQSHVPGDMLHKQKLRSKYKVTSSAAPGTTMGTIRIPLHVLGISSTSDKPDWTQRRFVNRERFIIDTPGVINEQQMIHLLPFEKQKELLRSKEIHPITFRFSPGKSLLLKPFVRIDLVDAPSPLLLTLFTNAVPHITKTTKLDDIDEKVFRAQDLVPLSRLVSVRGTHKSHASADLAFSSVGWVAVTGIFDKATFRIWLPKGIKPEDAFCTRIPPFLPYEFRGSIRKFFGSGERTR